MLPAKLRRASAALEQDAGGAAIRYASSIEDAVRTAELVLDTVPDELESKLEILTLLDRMAPTATLFATLTQTLSIADLASCTCRPEQCFALRFEPQAVYGSRSRQITLSYPPACVPQTLARVERFFHALGAEVQSVEDTSALP